MVCEIIYDRHHNRMRPELESMNRSESPRLFYDDQTVSGTFSIPPDRLIESRCHREFDAPVAHITSQVINPQRPLARLRLTHCRLPSVWHGAEEPDTKVNISAHGKDGLRTSTSANTEPFWCADRGTMPWLISQSRRSLGRGKATLRRTICPIAHFHARR